jgi:hypothetical protein
MFKFVSVCLVYLLLFVPVASAADEQILTEEAAQVFREQPGFMAELAQVDAEVQVAVALYQTGNRDLAQVHLRHTDAIIYRKLLSRMAARRASSFATEFNALTKAMTAKESYKSVLAKYNKFNVAIAASRGAGELVSARYLVPATRIILQKSAEFYSSGVMNGNVVDARQYQTAWGLMKAAKNIMAGISKKERKTYAKSLQDIDAAMANLNSLWPNLTGSDTQGGDPQMLRDATAKIELAALDIK